MWFLKHEHKKHHTRWMQSKHAKGILGLISFTESVCLPVITDPFLVAIILADRSRWLLYTSITIITSVLGGVLAYFLGMLFFDVFGVWMLDTFSLHEAFAAAQVQLSEAGFWFVFIGALTPIPYKLVALASGFGALSIVVFVIASIFGRTMRFFLTGYLSYAFGPLALQMFRQRSNLLLIIIIGIGVLYTLYKLF